MKIHTNFNLGDVVYAYDDQKKFFRGVVVGITAEATLVRKKSKMTVEYVLKDRHGARHHHVAADLSFSRCKQLHQYYPHGVNPKEFAKGPVVIKVPACVKIDLTAVRPEAIVPPRATRKTK